MSPWDAKYHTVIIILLFLVTLLPKGHFGATSIFLCNLSERQYCTQQSHWGKKLSSHPITGSRLWPIPDRDSLTCIPPPSPAPRHSAPANQSEVLLRLLPVAHLYGPRWFWKVCRLLCGCCWLMRILQIDDGNTAEKMYWFRVNTWKLECFSRMLILNFKSCPLSTAGTLTCMFWTGSSWMWKLGLRIHTWREAPSRTENITMEKRILVHYNSVRTSYTP